MIYLSIPGLPPSSNNAYSQRGKVRFLTKVGKKYKNETTAYLARTFRKELMLFKRNVGFQLYFRFTTMLQNKNWKPGGKINRYKKFDGANLTKLLEDVLADVGGYDDSQTMRSIWEKKQGEEDLTEVWAWNLEDAEGDPFDHEFVLRAIR